MYWLYWYVQFGCIHNEKRAKYEPVRWGYETDPETPIVIPQDCGVADLNRDNTLDFFDVSLLVTMCAEDRKSADLNVDGALNFFDISIFLNEYITGCK